MGSATTTKSPDSSGTKDGSDAGKTENGRNIIIEARKNRRDRLYKEAKEIVNGDRIIDDDFHKILYSHDVAPLPKIMGLMFKMTPDLIVKPKNAKEVSSLVKMAIKNDIPIIPRGGGTWGLGGAVPTNGGILLDMGSLNGILAIDNNNLTITVEPGITWKEVDDSVSRKGLFLGAYPSSAPGASVGGWINTGGIGIGSYKYGGVEQQVRSMEVVLPDGRIIEPGFNKVLSNSSGYNLGSLFFGAEGTLGVVTKVTLKLYPKPEEIRAVSYSFNDIKKTTRALYDLTRARIIPWHISFLDGNHLEFLRQTGKVAPKVEGIINMTFEGPTEIINYETKVADMIMRKYEGAQLSKEFSDHEWEERYYELRAKPIGPTALVGEVFIPVDKLSDMIFGIRKIIKNMKIRAAIVGMVADRNTIVLFPYVLTDERKMVKSLSTMAFIKKIGDLSFNLGGRPAGLGTFFSVNLKRLQGAGVGTIHDIKTSLDPYDIMNPGKLTEGVTRFGIPIPAFGFRMGMNMMGLIKGILPRDK